MTGLYYFIAFVFGISFLFILVTLLVGLIRVKFTVKKINSFLTKYKGIRGNILAATLGALTPFCSCTTVPIFAGLLETNISFGVATSFLIASPTINVVAIILLSVLFGPKVAIFYLGTAFVVAVLGGYILGKIPLKNYIKPSFISLSDSCNINTWRDIGKFSFKFFRYFFIILIFSAAIGALLYNYVPDELILKLALNNSLWAVFGAVLIGSVIYADIILLIPLGYVLMAKGVNQGIVLAFMLTASGLSISQILLLTKVIKLKPIIYFVSILIFLYTVFGIAFYYL